MQKEFNFSTTVVFDSSLFVEDIFNTCIRAESNTNLYYYLKIKTELGKVKYLVYGPCDENSNDVDRDFHIEFNSFEFNENKVIKLINSFLVNGIFNKKEKIVVAEEISDEEFFSHKDINVFSII